MANYYYIISEAKFFEDKAKAWDFVANTEIDLNGPCHSQIPSFGEVKIKLEEFNLLVEEGFAAEGRVELMARKNREEALWLIFNGIEDESSKAWMFRIGRGSDHDLTIDFIKYLGQTHGNFLFYSDTGMMSVITPEKDNDLIKSQLYGVS